MSGDVAREHTHFLAQVPVRILEVRAAARLSGRARAGARARAQPGAAHVGGSLPVHVVRLDEVTICSPFPPHLPGLGSCGAHFVGLNAKTLGLSFEGRPAEAWTREFFEGYRPAIEARVRAETVEHAGATAR